MEHDTNTISQDAIDSRLEKRLPLLQDSIELRLTKSFDTQLKGRLETAAKLFGWSFGLVALVFTLFGIKTVVDLRDAAKTTAVDEVRKSLSLDDPNSAVRRDVDRAIARGLVSSYYLTMARKQGSGLIRDFVLSESDARRLIDLIIEPSSEDRDFLDAADVLLQSDKNARGNHISRIFLGLASAKEDKYKWIQEQPAKRAALFDLAKGGAARIAARDVLADLRSNQTVLIAAIRYLARINDRDSIVNLEMAALRADESVSRAALEALARVNPESKALGVALSVRPDATFRTLAEAVRLAATVVPSSRIFADDPQQPLRDRLAKITIQEAMKRGAVFQLSANSTNQWLGLFISPRDPGGTGYHIPATILQHDGLNLFASMLQEDAKDGPALKRLVRMLCLEYEGRCNGIVNVQFQRGGRVKMQNGKMVGLTEAPNGGYLVASKPAPNSSISFNWINQEGLRVKAAVEEIEDSAAIAFSVRLLTDIADDRIEANR